MDGFACFSNRLKSVPLPHKFKPSNYSKYDGKTESKQWLRVYYTTCGLVGGTNDAEALFFPMPLESVPVQWFNKLRKGSIDTWEDLKALFVENFAGVLTRLSNRNELRNCKLPNESLREYYRRFSEKRSTVSDVSDYDMIEFFSDGILERWQYQDFSEKRSTVSDVSGGACGVSPS